MHVLISIKTIIIVRSSSTVHSQHHQEKKKICKLFQAIRDLNIKTPWNRLNTLIRLRVTQFKESKRIEPCHSLDFGDGGRFLNKRKKLTGTISQRHYSVRMNRILITDPSSITEDFATTLTAAHKVPLDIGFNNQFN